MTRLAGWWVAVVGLSLAGRAAIGSGRVAPALQQDRRILLFYDMEGASGIDQDAQFSLASPEAFAAGRRLLTADVNAVIAGLFDGGATAVDVFNTHGSLSDTLVSRTDLDPRAGIISRRGPRVAYDPSSPVLTASYAGVVSIAAHDKPRSGGFSPHTVAVGTTPVVNGQGLTETDLLALAVGVRGIPMIMASGDDVLGRSLSRTLPGIEYVVVKRADRGEVVLRSPDSTAPALRAAAARSMARLVAGELRPWRLDGPVTAGMLPSYPAWLYPTMDALPGLTRRGDTVTFVADDYRAAYRGIMLLLNMAASSREGLVFDRMLQVPEGRALLSAASDTVTARWKAFERGEWRP